jgi:hypothetical protein
MGKVIFWIVVVFIILFAVRLVNANKARARRAAKAAAAPAAEPASQAMIRCDDCGVFVPRNEASIVAGRHRCADPQCANRREAARP